MQILDNADKSAVNEIKIIIKFNTTQALIAIDCH